LGISGYREGRIDGRETQRMRVVVVVVVVLVEVETEEFGLEVVWTEVV
jgi:hypothetical protein